MVYYGIGHFQRTAGKAIYLAAFTKGRFGDRWGNTGILGATKWPGNEKSPDTGGGFCLSCLEIDKRSEPQWIPTSYSWLGIYIISNSLCCIEIHVKSEPGWIRTIDTRLKRAMLYQLSYGPTQQTGDLRLKTEGCGLRSQIECISVSLCFRASSTWAMN